jgi:hypothetical protein
MVDERDDIARLIGELREAGMACGMGLFMQAADALLRLQRDAERYRWLRDEAWDNNAAMAKGRVIWNWDSSLLDAAIDAELTGGREG